MACIYCALLVVVEAVMWSQKAELQVPVLKAFFISNYSWFVVVITEFWSQNGYLQFRFLRPHHRFNYNQECTINTSHLKNLGSYFIARLIIYFINVYALCIIIVILGVKASRCPMQKSWFVSTVLAWSCAAIVKLLPTDLFWTIQ